MNVLHFSFASDGGAGRAGRRLSLACSAAGLTSCFSFVSGDRRDESDISFASDASMLAGQSDAAAQAMDNLQWDFIPSRRTQVSNTLLSIPYPAVDVARHPAFEIADIIHLHWPTWGIAPNVIKRWLDGGRTIFWTLHDFWPMTGGCHYPSGCEQFKTSCMKCPQIQDDMGLVSNGFTEKIRSYCASGKLSLIAPSRWIAKVAEQSAMFPDRLISVVRNPVELDVFKPHPDRTALRMAFGVQPNDLVLLFGSFDLEEQRKGVKYLLEAVSELVKTGDLAAVLDPGARIYVAAMGRSSSIGIIQGVVPMDFGNLESDDVLADVLAIADLVCVPSLEDNYPNMIIEAFACGTPCLGTPVGGIPEMIEPGRTGILVEASASTQAIMEGILQFAREHFGSMTMRTACRESAVRQNDLLSIGNQIRLLYEAALGRPMSAANPELHGRMARAFGKSPVIRTTAAGPDFLKFPLNMALIEGAAQPQKLRNFVSPLPEQQSQSRRLLSVRTYHGHHSARSGPYQYLRFIDKVKYCQTQLAVPLGTELVGDYCETYRKAGALMGTRAFGQQANAWMAETEVLLQCAVEPVDLVHFIDGELGGWLIPMIEEGAFFNGRRPAVISTFHQPPLELASLINADLVGNYDGVIVLCEAQRDFLAGYVDPARIYVVPHGIDTGFFHPSSGKQADARAAGTFRMLLVGHWLRDLDAAFSVFRAARASGLRAELTIVSPNFPEGRREDGIEIRSGLSDEELRQAYWDADLLFIPLRDATANNAVLEAMACGRPLVSTAVGGVVEAVGSDAGILCPPGDSRMLTQAVLSLAGDPQLRDAMGRAGRARAEKMDWSISAGKHQDVYEKVLQGKAANRSRHKPVREGAVRSTASAATADR